MSWIQWAEPHRYVGERFHLVRALILPTLLVRPFNENGQNTTSVSVSAWFQGREGAKWGSLSYKEQP